MILLIRLNPHINNSKLYQQNKRGKKKNDMQHYEIRTFSGMFHILWNPLKSDDVFVAVEYYTRFRDNAKTNYCTIHIEPDLNQVTCHRTTDAKFFFFILEYISCFMAQQVPFFQNELKTYWVILLENNNIFCTILHRC